MTRRWLAVALLVAITTTGCAGAGTGVSSSPAPPPQSSAAPTSRPLEPIASPVLAPSPPMRVQVPTIGVDSGLLDLGLQADGTLEVPPDGTSAGWYVDAPTPGELGPAVIAAHVDWEGRPGVFHRLHEMRSGEEISVVRDDGTTAVFVVTTVEQFAKDEFPTQTVYGDIDHAGLRLITCGGAFDGSARSYVDNVVVFAEFDRLAPA